MATDFVELERGTAVLYGACGGVWVMILFGKPGPSDMRLARPALETMLRRAPEGFPSLTWILPQAGFSMDADAREAAAEVTRAFDRSLLAQATVIEGTGFQAAAVRAVVTGLDVMSRTTGPKKTFATLEPAVAWCLARRPESVRATSPAEVIAAIAAARAALERGS